MNQTVPEPGKNSTRSPAMTIMVLCLILLSLPTVLIAGEPHRDVMFGGVGIKAGIIGRGNVDFGTLVGRQATSFAIGGMADFPAGEKLLYGASIDIFRMSWKVDTDEWSLDESAVLVDLGINFKAVFTSRNGRFALRPGVGVGYGALKRLATINGSNYLTLRGFVEVVARTTDAMALVFEGGVWYAPSGGDATADITIGPLLLARVGVLF